MAPLAALAWGDVAVSENSLFVSMDEPDLYTPGIVRYLVEQGAEIMRVAEVEHSLERAYLDLVSRPDVLICDEVTSALDVSVQAAIVELLGELQKSLDLAMLFVTHNLPLVRSIAQRVAVMSVGRVPGF